MLFVLTDRLRPRARTWRPPRLQGFGCASSSISPHVLFAAITMNPVEMIQTTLVSRSAKRSAARRPPAPGYTAPPPRSPPAPQPKKPAQPKAQDAISRPLHQTTSRSESIHDLVGAGRVGAAPARQLWPAPSPAERHWSTASLPSHRATPSALLHPISKTFVGGEGEDAVKLLGV